MYDIELHFHTSQSSHCGRVPAEEGVKQYKEHGYAGVVVTDHFSRSERGGPEDQKWDEICSRFLWGYRAAKKAAEGTDFHQPEDLSDRRTGFVRMPHTGQELAQMLREGAFAISGLFYEE